MVDEAVDLRALAALEAGGRLVEQQERRSGARAPSPAPASSAGRRAACRCVRARCRDRPNSSSSASMPRSAPATGALKRARPEEVLLDAGAPEGVGLLEAAHHAEPADGVERLAGDVALAEEHAAGRGREHAADHVDERGLARAVGPDDARRCRPRGTLERDVLEDLQAAEPLRERLDAKLAAACGAASARGGSPATGSMRSRDAIGRPVRGARRLRALRVVDELHEAADDAAGRQHQHHDQQQPNSPAESCA